MAADCYSVLNVDRFAPRQDIRRAFCRLVKKYHPDRNRHDPAAAAAKLRDIVNAYRVLSDDEAKLLHDQRLRFEEQNDASMTWERFLRRQSDLELRCREMFNDLLNGRGQRAVQTYEKLSETHPDLDILTILGIKDYLDFKFLLGEEYEIQGLLRQALLHYEEVHQEEKEEPRQRYFFDEVEDRLNRIYCTRIVRECAPAEAVEYYRRALNLRHSKRDQAQIHKKIAECSLQIGDYVTARKSLEKAFELFPSIKGLDRLAARLNRSTATRSRRSR